MNAAHDLSAGVPALPTTSQAAPAAPLNFIDFAEKLVAERTTYIRGVDKERNRFNLHVRTAAFAMKPIADIRPIEIGEWHRAMAEKQAQDRRAPRTLSRHTIERSSALMSVIFAEALTRGLIPSNPCLGIRLRKRERATKEPWAYLTLDEQRAVKACRAIPEADRDAILFAFGCGLRQGEQFNLRIDDVHVDGPEPFVFVRFGSPGEAPKSGKCRRVPLFGDALDAARRQLVRVPSLPNRYELLFPSVTGGRRSVGKPLGRGVKIAGKWVDPFHIHLAAAGAKKIRWHDLRHTCGSSLAIGYWGRVWTLIEIRDMLGHSSVTITERYAHLADTVLKSAARETAREPAAPPRAPAGCMPGIVKAIARALRRNAA